MAGSEYYGDVTVGGRSLNDATPEEWDQAHANALRGRTITDADISYNGDSLYWQDNLTSNYLNNSTNTWNEFTTWNEYTDDIDYKFRERELIEEFRKYIDTTYSGHYGQGGLQSSEVIVDRGHGMGFFAGNIDKYNGRYGNKGENPADWRKDIMKTIHYGFLKLFEHDRIHGNNGNTTD